jgi:heavy metal translocating P-type ATPase
MAVTKRSHAKPLSFEALIAVFSLGCIIGYLIFNYGFNPSGAHDHYTLGVQIWLDHSAFRLFANRLQFNATLMELPLIAVLLAGGLPLIVKLTTKLFKGDWGADLLAGIAIITSVLLDEYLAGALIVLMLSGGAVLEAYAVKKASSVLDALANRMPSVAHRTTTEGIVDIAIEDVKIGDTLVILPHEICPVDGSVIKGSGVMDESYLTGEPYMMSKVAGSSVLSGAINGDAGLTIQAGKLAIDSRYAKIMNVMRESEQQRPTLRRLGDQLGAIYTPIAVAIALIAWGFSGDAVRFLAVLVIATPCPLLIGIPVTIISSISLAAKRDIVIKNPAILETIGSCRTAIFDKTGTLTYGRPVLTELLPVPEFSKDDILRYAASLERYSKHPLSSAIVAAADKAAVPLSEVANIQELPGKGLNGHVLDKQVQITSRKHFTTGTPKQVADLPPVADGMECIVLIDDRYAATLRFRDEVRSDSSSFINHLKPSHLFDKVMLVSGDRESEVRYLAELVGIEHVYSGQTPEQKLQLVRKETELAKTVFMGDGINDAPALTAATIGIAFGQNSDITAESADAVIMDSSLLKVDELFHIGKRMRTIALQSAVGGMALSIIGMGFAGVGYLSPVAGAITQEIIDVFAVLNALRAAVPPGTLSDYGR